MQQQDAFVGWTDANNNWYDRFTKARTATILFLGSGSQDSLESYFTEWTRANTHVNALYGEIVACEEDPRALVTLQSIRSLLDDVLIRQITAIWLAADAYNMSATRYQYILERLAASDKFLSYNTTLLKPSLDAVFAAYAIKPSPAPATSPATDRLLTKERKLLVARSLVFDDLYSKHWVRIEHLRRQMARETSLGRDLDSIRSRHTRLFAASIAIASATFLALVFLVVSNKKHSQWRASVPAIVGSGLGAMASLVIIVVSVILFVEVDRMIEVDDIKAAFTVAKNTTLTGIPATLFKGRMFTEFGDKAAFHEYFNEKLSNSYYANYADIIDQLSDVGASDNEIRSIFSTVSLLRARTERVMHFGDIAVLLAAWSYYGVNSTGGRRGDGLVTSPAATATQRELYQAVDVVYNYATEISVEKDMIQSTAPLSFFYTNNSYDALLPASQQKILARHALGSTRFRRHWIGFKDNAEQFLADSTDIIDRISRRKRDSVESLSSVSLYIAAALLILTVLCGMYSIYDILHSSFVVSDARLGTFGTGTTTVVSGITVSNGGGRAGSSSSSAGGGPLGSSPTALGSSVTLGSSGFSNSGQAPVSVLAAVVGAGRGAGGGGRSSPYAAIDPSGALLGGGSKASVLLTEIAIRSRVSLVLIAFVFAGLYAYDVTMLEVLRSVPHTVNIAASRQSKLASASCIAQSVFNGNRSAIATPLSVDLAARVRDINSVRDSLYLGDEGEHGWPARRSTKHSTVLFGGVGPSTPFTSFMSQSARDAASSGSSASADDEDYVGSGSGSGTSSASVITGDFRDYVSPNPLEKDAFVSSRYAADCPSNIQNANAMLNVLSFAASSYGATASAFPIVYSSIGRAAGSASAVFAARQQLASGSSSSTGTVSDVPDEYSDVWRVLTVNGVEDVVAQLLAIFDAMASSVDSVFLNPATGAAQAPRTLLSNLRQRFEKAVAMTAYPLSVELQASTAMYASDAQSFMDALSVGHYCFTVAVLALIMLIFLFILWPMLEMLAKEDDGTRLLLRMIPAQVRREVPAVAEYLEHGTITQNLKLQRITEISRELSTDCLVVINDHGIIEHVSTATLEEFGYRSAVDLVGKNVKILMPDQTARRHDGYLQRYHRTGVRIILDRRRRVTAMRADGSTFVAEIVVKEIIGAGGSSGASSYSGRSGFFGLIRNVTVDVKLENAQRLNEAVAEMCTDPIVVIDPRGLITRCNSAAYKAFGFAPREVLMRNVSLLMPAAVGDRHDGYLANYQATRRSVHVINKTREVIAVRKGGERFASQLTVKELLSDSGATEGFIGFFRDMSLHFRIAHAAMQNESIMQVSPVPVVGFTPSGEITRFSPSACDVLGFTQADVIGKNLSDLLSEVGVGMGVAAAAPLPQADLMPSNFGPMGMTSQNITTTAVSPSNHQQVAANANDAFRSLQQRAEGHTPMQQQLQSNATNTSFANANAAYGYGNANNIIPQPPPPPMEEAVPIAASAAPPTGGSYSNGGGAALEPITSRLIRHLRSQQQLQAAMAAAAIGGSGPLGGNAAISAAATAAGGVSGSDLPSLRGVSSSSAAGAKLQHMRAAASATAPAAAAADYAPLHAEARTRDGLPLPVSVHLHDVTVADGSTEYIAFLLDDREEITHRRSAHMAAAMFQSSPVPLITADEDANILSCNAAAEKLVGYRRAQLVGSSAKMLMEPRVAAEHDSFLARFRANPANKKLVDNRVTINIRRGDGRVLPVEVMLRYVSQDSLMGKQRVFYLSIKDGTDATRLQEATGLSEAIGALYTVPMISIATNGTVVTYNVAAQATFGWAEREVIGRNVKMLMPDEIAARHDGYLAAYLETRQGVMIDQRRVINYKHKNGEIRPAEILIQEVNRDDGETLYVSYLKDLRKEMVLESSAAIASAIIDSSPLPIIIINAQGRVIRFSRAAAHVFQWREEDIVGKNIKVLMTHDVAKVHDRYIRNYIKTGVKRMIGTTRQVYAMRKDGMTINVEVSVKETRRSELLHDYSNQIRVSSIDIFVPLESRISGASSAASHRSSAMMTAAALSGGGGSSGTPGPRLTAAGSDPFSGSGGGGGSSIHTISLSPAGLRGAGGTSNIMELAGQLSTVASGYSAAGSTSATTTSSTTQKNNEDDDILFIGYINDLSREYILRQANELRDVILSESSIPIVQLDVDGRIAFANPALAYEFNYSPEELVGHDASVLVPDVTGQSSSFLARFRPTPSGSAAAAAAAAGGGLGGSTNAGGTAMQNNEASVAGGAFSGDGLGGGLANSMTNNNSVATLFGGASTSTVAPPPTLGGDNNNFHHHRALGSDDTLTNNNNTASSGTNQNNTTNGTNNPNNNTQSSASSSSFAPVEAIARRRDGTEFPVEVHVREIVINRVKTYFSYLRNVEQLRLVKDEKLVGDTIIQHSATPLVIVSDMGLISEFNPAAEEVFGYSRREVLGQSVSMLQPPNPKTSRAGRLLNAPDFLGGGNGGADFFQRDSLSSTSRAARYSTSRAQAAIGADDSDDDDEFGVGGGPADGSVTGMVAGAGGDTATTITSVSNNPLLPQGTTTNNSTNNNNNNAAHHSIRKEVFLDNLLRSAKLKHPVDITRRISAKKRDGTVFPMEVTLKEIVPSEELEGAPIVYVLYAKDLSHEETVESAQALAAAISTISQTPFVCVNVKGEITMFSKAAEEEFGYTAEEIMGRDVGVLQQPPAGGGGASPTAAAATTLDAASAASGATIGSGGGTHHDDHSNGTVSVGGASSSTTAAGRAANAAGGGAAGGAINQHSLRALMRSRTTAAANNAGLTEAHARLVGRRKNGTTFTMDVDIRHFDEEGGGAAAAAAAAAVAGAHHPHHGADARRDPLSGIQLSAMARKGFTNGGGSGGDSSTTSRFVNYASAACLRNVTEEVESTINSSAYSKIVELTGAPLVIINERGIIETCNAALEEKYGYGPKELIGRNVKILMLPEVAAHHDGYLASYLETGERKVLGQHRRVYSVTKQQRIILTELFVHELITPQLKKRNFYGFLRDLTDQISLHQAFKMSDAITDLSPIPIIAIDPFGAILKFSAASSKLFEYEAGDVGGGPDGTADDGCIIFGKTNVSILMRPSDAVHHDGYLAAATDQIKRTNGTYVGRARKVIGVSKTGRLISLELTISPVMQGKVVKSYVGFLRDMTAQDRLESERQISREIASHSRQPIIVISHKGTIESINRHALQLFGYPSDSHCVGRDVAMLMPPDVGAAHDGFVQNFLRGGRNNKRAIDTLRTVEAVGSRGERITVDIGVKELNVPGSEPKFLAYIHTVSEHLVRQESVAFNEALFSLSPMAFVLADATGRIIQMSEMCCQLFGYGRNEVVNSNVKILMPSAVAAVHDTYLANYIHSGVRKIIGRNVRLPGVHRSGQQFEVTLEVKELLGKDGQRFFVAVFKEVIGGAVPGGDGLAPAQPLPVPNNGGLQAPTSF